MDPNELIGPVGYAIQNYVVPGGFFGYKIIFENETNATAPAQMVDIKNPLSTTLDWITFELAEISFGDTFIAIPAGAKHFQTNLSLTMNGEDFTLEIEAGIDLLSGQVFAHFDSIDPLFGLPPSVGVGFLPPEDGTGQGTGHVSYHVKPKPNLPLGTEIRNVAYIQFDVNPIISTDQIDPHDPSKGVDPNKQALVTIDSILPASSVAALPAVTTTPSFLLCWSGTDLNGS